LIGIKVKIKDVEGIGTVVDIDNVGRTLEYIIFGIEYNVQSIIRPVLPVCRTGFS
jgi:hypothetical protein